MSRRFKFSIWHLLAITSITAIVLWWMNLGDPVDLEMANDVPLVIRAELLEVHGGGKYHWTTVAVIRVFKNDTDDTIPETLKIAHYGWSVGPPSGQSTLYLTRYNEGHPEYGWKLHEADSKLGFSHHSTVK